MRPRAPRLLPILVPALLLSAADAASATAGAEPRSDALGGLFFTHYLVSGLRGAADLSGDGRVTLNEAYPYAFHETLRRTATTQAGPQHAAYDVQLAGTGDLVLTDVTRRAAALVLPEDLSGQVFVRDEAGDLVAEVRKAPGREIALAVRPGAYDVTIKGPAGLFGAWVIVPRGGCALVDAGALVTRATERTALRGAEPPAPEVAAAVIRAQELAQKRERGTLMLWGGGASTSLGACCLLRRGTLLGLDAAVRGPTAIDDPTPCSLLGGSCVLIGGLLAAFGLPVALLGKDYLEEAEANVEPRPLTDESIPAEGPRYAY